MVSGWIFRSGIDDRQLEGPIENRKPSIVNPEVRVFDDLEQLSSAAPTRLEQQAPWLGHFAARRPQALGTMHRASKRQQQISS